MQEDNKKEQQMYELISNWLNEYKRAKSSVEKAKPKALIVSRMLPIVKRIARTIARRAYDPIEDLVQAGSIGLLKAIDSFRPEINDNFNGFENSISCITQSNITGNIIVTCWDGNTYLLNPPNIDFYLIMILQLRKI